MYNSINFNTIIDIYISSKKIQIFTFKKYKTPYISINNVSKFFLNDFPEMEGQKGLSFASSKLIYRPIYYYE